MQHRLFYYFSRLSSVTQMQSMKGKAYNLSFKAKGPRATIIIEVEHQ